MKKSMHIALCVIMVIAMLAGCAPTATTTPIPSEVPEPTTEPVPEQAAFKAGTYEASARGMNGPVPVTVTVTEDAIESVVVGENTETLGLGDIAAEKLPARIVEAQSLAVDTVSGATITSYAILSAVEDALSQAEADIAALKVKAPEKELVKGDTETVDVVIVGAGLSGIMAAYDLKIKNPDTSYILLEQLDVIMGSLPMAGGAIIADKSKLHTENGMESSIDDIIKILEFASAGPVNNEYIKNIYANAEELLNRLIDWGAPLGNPTLSKEPASDKVYAFWADGRGAGFAHFFNEQVKKDAINLRLNSKATELIVTDGVVTGVKVEDKEKTYEIHAKAVLLATGGFGMNQELIKKYSPYYVGGISRTTAGATGDGFLMTEQFNPEIVGNGMMGGGPRASLALGSIASMFAVSTEGTRFANESDNLAIVDGMGGTLTAYRLMDANFPDQDTLQAHIDAGLIAPFDTLEALAKEYGINESNLLATVKAYNEAVDAGTSPGFDLPVEKAQKLEKAPFYAEKINLSWFGTIPGIKVDNQMRILDGNGVPVPGLYATGELTEGNFYTRTYPGAGVGISYATYTGPYAVRNIIEDLNK